MTLNAGYFLLILPNRFSSVSDYLLVIIFLGEAEKYDTAASTYLQIFQNFVVVTNQKKSAITTPLASTSFVDLFIRQDERQKTFSIEVLQIYVSSHRFLLFRSTFDCQLIALKTLTERL